MTQKIMSRFMYALLLAFFCWAPTQAQVKEPATGINFPEQGSNYGANFTLTGVGVRKKLGFKVYAIGSYLETGKLVKGKDVASQLLADGPAKLVIMQFVRDVDAGKIRETFEEGLQKNVPSYATAAKKDGDAFLNAMVDLKPNDKMEICWKAGGQIILTVKGQTKARLQNAALAKGIWSIWFGPSPISGDLKQSLVAKAQ